MNNLSKESITKFIKSWINGQCVDELVEQGYCADLATLIWEHFDHSNSIHFNSCDNPVHTWIEFEGIHFDLQNPEGVSAWQKLEYFKLFPNAVLED